MLISQGEEGNRAIMGLVVAGFLFSTVVFLGVFHNLRAQDIKVLGSPRLGGLTGWEYMRKAGWCHSR